MLREGVRRIAASFGHRYWLEKARSGGKTTELWGALAKEGYLGVSVPEAYGGGGLGMHELCIVCEELAGHGCPLLLLVVSPAICATVIARFGSDAQKSAFLPGLARGTTTFCFALTEPDAGSNSHQLSTSARRDADGSWILSGQKYYISGIDEAQHALVVARTGTDEKTGRGQLSLFLVDTDSAGLRADPIPMEITSPERQFTVFFDDVRVPADRMLGAPGAGLKILFHGLNPERITSAAFSCGLARYALEKGAAYAKERGVWGAPIATHQGIAHPLARAKMQTEMARLMTWKACTQHDRGKDAGEAANMARLAAADAANEALDAAIQTHGGNGLATEYGLADLWGLARLQRIAPVSREMILNFVAQHSLGLPRSY